MSRSTGPCGICTDDTTRRWPVGQWACGAAHAKASWLCGGCAARLLRRRCPLCRAAPTSQAGEQALRAGHDFEPAAQEPEFLGPARRTDPEAAELAVRAAALARVRRGLAYFAEHRDLRRALNRWQPWFLPSVAALDAGLLSPGALTELAAAVGDMETAIFFYETTPSERKRRLQWGPMAERAAATAERLLAGQIAPPEPEEPEPERFQAPFTSFYD